MRPAPLAMSRADWSIFATLALMWGCAFLFIELALDGFAPITLVFLRIALAALVMIVVLAVARRPLPRDPRLWGAFAWLGLLNLALPFVLVTWSQTHISAGLASILNATTPLWGVFVAHLMTADEKATPLKIAGAVLGISGVGVMIGGDALAGIGDDLLAQLACLLATLCYALAGVYGRRFAGWGVGALEISAGQLITAALMLAPFALLIDRPWLAPPPSLLAVAALVALALVSTTLAYILYFRLIASAGATNALAITFAIPLVTILLGLAILGEALEVKHLLGMALILAGLLAIDGRLFRRRAR